MQEKPKTTNDIFKLLPSSGANFFNMLFDLLQTYEKTIMDLKDKMETLNSFHKDELAKHQNELAKHELEKIVKQMKEHSDNIQTEK